MQGWDLKNEGYAPVLILAARNEMNHIDLMLWKGITTSNHGHWSMSRLRRQLANELWRPNRDVWRRHAWSSSDMATTCYGAPYTTRSCSTGMEWGGEPTFGVFVWRRWPGRGPQWWGGGLDLWQWWELTPMAPLGCKSVNSGGGPCLSAMMAWLIGGAC
jgi:hypothetical protein